jgi:hypothetical protein
VDLVLGGAWAVVRHRLVCLEMRPPVVFCSRFSGRVATALYGLPFANLATSRNVYLAMTAHI